MRRRFEAPILVQKPNAMNLRVLFRSASILWIVWGLVHILAGVLTMSKILSNDIGGAMAGISDAVDPDLLEGTYHAAVGAVIGQHGFNLFWIGIVTLLSALGVWKGRANAIYLAAITGGLADLGYFLFMDLGGYVRFVPGTVMTLVSASAIVLSFYALRRQNLTAST
mgnify:CR=1 FL=1